LLKTGRIESEQIKSAPSRLLKIQKFCNRALRGASHWVCEESDSSVSTSSRKNSKRERGEKQTEGFLDCVLENLRSVFTSKALTSHRPYGFYIFTVERLRAIGLTKGVVVLEKIGSDPSRWTAKDYITTARWTVKSGPPTCDRIMKLLTSSIPLAIKP
jgi:hypothetical protein